MSLVIILRISALPPCCHYMLTSIIVRTIALNRKVIGIVSLYQIFFAAIHLHLKRPLLKNPTMHKATITIRNTTTIYSSACINLHTDCIYIQKKLTQRTVFNPQ